MQLLCKIQSNLSIGCVHYNFDQAEILEENVHLAAFGQHILWQTFAWNI